MTVGITKDVWVCVCWGVGAGSRKSRSEELGNSAPASGIHIKAMRMFHPMPSPWIYGFRILSPVTWEFGVWPGWQMSKRRVSRDEVKEAIWKLALQGKNHTLCLVLWPETSCNFSNRGSHPSTSSSNWKIIARCRPFLPTTWRSGCLRLCSQGGEFTGYFWCLEDKVLQNPFSAKKSIWGEVVFLLLLLARGPKLPVLISPSIRFPYLFSLSCKPEQGVQPKHRRSDASLYCILILITLATRIHCWVTWPDTKLDVGRRQNVRLEEF